MANRVEYILDLQDNLSGKLGKIDKNVEKSGKGFNKLGGMITGALSGIAVGAIFKNAINKMIEFDAKISNLSAITGAVGKDLDFLSKKALEFGKNSTRGAIEIVEAFKLVGSAKPELLKNNKALADVTAKVLTLSDASGMDLVQSTEALTDTLNQFSAGADQAGRFINVLAAGAKFGSAEIPVLSEAIKEFGVLAASSNISIEQSAALVETLAEKGIKGSKAGIQLRNVLTILASGAEKTNPQIVGLNTALENLGKQNLSTAELTKMFGRESFLTAQILTENINRVDELKVAMTGTNTAYEQAETNTSNLKSSLSQLGNAWTSFTLSLMSGDNKFGVFLGKQVDKLTDLLNRIQKLTTEPSRKEKRIAELEKEEKEFRDVLRGGTNTKKLRTERALYNIGLQEKEQKEALQKPKITNLISGESKMQEDAQKQYDIAALKIKIAKEEIKKLNTNYVTPNNELIKSYTGIQNLTIEMTGTDANPKEVQKAVEDAISNSLKDIEIQ